MIKEWEELNAKMTSPLTTEEYFQFRDVLATLLIRNSEALLELVKAVELQNKNWQSPLVTEALSKLERKNT